MRRAASLPGTLWAAERGLGVSSGRTPRESWAVSRAGDRWLGVAREPATCLKQVLPAPEKPPSTDSMKRLSGALPKA